MAEDCFFCSPHERDIPELRARTAFARWDGFPVAEGHLLVVPYRHVESFFGLTVEEVADVHWLAADASKLVAADGWTIGVNEGRAAGRTVDHIHLHLIPRRLGDVEDPRGGIRNVLPGGPRPSEWAETR